MSRYLSIFLPHLATERTRRRAADPQAPAGVWATRGAARRIVAANPAARRLGLAPGTALASARAMVPGLVLIEQDPAALSACLEAILAWSRRFTPLAALDPPDGLMLDVAGVAHLFGGETGLVRDVLGQLSRQGFSARLGLADSPELAFALARWGARAIAPAGLDETALTRLAAPLPLDALRLSDGGIARLAQAGLRRVADVLNRPRAPLAARFGPALFARLDAMLGRTKTAIAPLFEAPAYLVERTFAEPIARREDVEGAVLSLAGELSRLLERHGEGLRRVEASFFRVDGVVKSLEVGASRPLRAPAAIARLFHERLETLGEEGLDTGYGFDLARLAALEVERLDPRQGTIAEILAAGAAGRLADEELADLVDRLGARLGQRRVLRLAPHGSHLPERAAATAPCVAVPAASWPAAALCEGAPARPLRLLERPEPIEALAVVPDGPPLRFRWRRLIHDVASAEGPERIAPEWWRDADGLTRDYFRAEDAQGRRFWLFRQGLYERETARPNWFMHGMFG